MTADPRVESVAKARAGERYQTAVLSEGNVFAIRQSGQSVRHLCSEYGVSETTIRNILNGKRWKHTLHLAEKHPNAP